MNKHAIKVSVALFLLTGVFGCTSVSGGLAKPEVKGFRYALPEPMLLVAPDPANAGVWKTTIEWVPRSDRVFAVHATNFLASNTFKITTAGGVLTRVEMDAKADQIPKELITASADIAKESLAVLGTEKAAESAQKGTPASRTEALMDVAAEKKESPYTFEDLNGPILYHYEDLLYQRSMTLSDLARQLQFERVPVLKKSPSNGGGGKPNPPQQPLALDEFTTTGGMDPTSAGVHLVPRIHDEHRAELVFTREPSDSIKLVVKDPDGETKELSMGAGLEFQPGEPVVIVAFDSLELIPGDLIYEAMVMFDGKAIGSFRFKLVP